MNLSNEQVIAQLLNPHEEGIVVHSGTKVAELEEVDSTMVTNVEGAKMAADSADISVAKMELLHTLVEQATALLMSNEKKELFELLVEYHNVLATSVGELGSIKVLKHMVHTKESVSIHQHVRRLPPCRKEKVHLLLQNMVSETLSNLPAVLGLHQWCWLKRRMGHFVFVLTTGKSMSSQEEMHTLFPEWTTHWTH